VVALYCDRKRCIDVGKVCNTNLGVFKADHFSFYMVYQRFSMNYVPAFQHERRITRNYKGDQDFLDKVRTVLPAYLPGLGGKRRFHIALEQFMCISRNLAQSEPYLNGHTRSF
jgi:hypothetical protein